LELALGGVPALGVEEEGFVVDGRAGFVLHGDRAAEGVATPEDYVARPVKFLSRATR
jgi:hypothetical protein